MKNTKERNQVCANAMQILHSNLRILEHGVLYGKCISNMRLFAAALGAPPAVEGGFGS